ncbi:MAG: hypothetical protein D3904_09150, partial [Candidatus Electrothrix sp. EH2]|nr:hypothetical protein [Candidatus Electrothrix sp. EH2]
MINLKTESSSAIKNTEVMKKKLDSYLRQTGIKDRAKARHIIARHLHIHASKYPSVLFRSGTLYLFTADGMNTARALAGASGADYLRFDGERITRLDPLYYLGPEAERYTGAASGFWDSGFSS